MIASLTGRVQSRGADHLVLDVGGVGLVVNCAPGLLAGVGAGEVTTVATSLVVREDSLTLFGFADDDARTVFEQLQGVSGVGPRLAQAVLAVHAPDALRAIVAREDVAALMTVPGVGRKGAQRLVLELKDRLGPPTTLGFAPAARAVARPGAPAWQEQIAAALVGLGWAARDSDRAIEAVRALSDDEAAAARGDDGGRPDATALLRLALKSLDVR